MAYPYLIGYVSIKDVPILKEEDIKKLDIINLAFGHIEGGVVVSRLEEVYTEFTRLRGINPSLRVVLSIGGWSAGGFSEMASDEGSRQRFIESTLEHIEKYDLDGIDFDWEYPCISIAGIKALPEDKYNFTTLLRESRKALEQHFTKPKLLTIAVAGDEYYIHCTEMDQVQKYVDYVQLMTYDLRGGFTVQTGHHANLYPRYNDFSRASAHKAVTDFYNAGVPKNKLVVGVAFYSRKWTGVPDVDHGIMQMAQSTGGYGPPYHQLVEEFINKNGFTRYWDDEAKAPFLFDGETFISYDDPESLFHKTNYVHENELGGIMYWEHGTDRTGHLLDVLHQNRQQTYKREA